MSRSHRLNLLVGSVVRGRGLRIAASLALSAAMLWLALRGIDGDDLARQLRAADGGWIAVALAFYWAELVLRGYRWSLILVPVRRIKLVQVLESLLVGYAANNVLPARLGELVRADLIGRLHGFSRLSAVGTIVIERLLDMFAVLACAALGISLLLTAGPGAGATLMTTVVVLVAASASVTAALYLTTTLPDRTWLRRFPQAKRRVAAVADGLRSIQSTRLLAGATAVTALIWVLNGVSLWAMLRAVGTALNYQEIVLLIGVSGIAAAIPSAPANLGTLQFAFVTAFAAIGQPTTPGFAAALLVQVFLLGSVTVVGAATYAAGTWRRNRKSPPHALERD